jgi:hypothetical protein
VEARLSLEPTLHRERTWFVLLPALATYIEFEGRMKGFLAAIADARQKPITYSDLFAAYSRPFGKSLLENGCRTRIERSFRSAVRALVEAGFVEEVVPGPCSVSDESIADLLSASKRSRRATGRAMT